MVEFPMNEAPVETVALGAEGMTSRKTSEVRHNIESNSEAKRQEKIARQVFSQLAPMALVHEDSGMEADSRPWPPGNSRCEPSEFHLRQDAVRGGPT